MNVNIQTTCEFCTFAKKEENQKENICLLNRIEKYKKNNKANLQENGFYLINSFCNTCRSKSIYPNITPEQVRKEVEVTFTYIINGKEGNYWRLLKNILSLSIIPKSVYVVVDKFTTTEIEKYKEYSQWYNNKESNLLIKRYVEKKDFLSCCDDIVKKLNTQYCGILNYNSQLNNTLQELDITINDNLEPLVAIINNDDYMCYYSVTLYKLLGGNKERKLRDKVLDRFEEEKDKGTIWKITQ